MAGKTVISLRLRLFLLILTPLILVAMALGYWRYTVAQHTAQDLFDRGLLSTALAISRDVAISEGDALSRTTQDLMEKAAGGEIFYHVMGPNGIYVTGYAWPPRVEGNQVAAAPTYGLANHRGKPVRVLRISELSNVANLSGSTTVTVWQHASDRQDFANSLALRAASLMGILLVCLAVLVWFGVHFGLGPLRELQAAIALRSSDDLREIARPLPVEVTGIVAALNRLFLQVRSNIETRQAFISDAAHQLRNPAAAILALAETIDGAQDPAERKKRTSELVDAARSSAHLTDQILSFERLRHHDGLWRTERFDLRDAAHEASLPFAELALMQNIHLSFEPAMQPVLIKGDRLMIIEAIRNLVDNALQHGGPSVNRITVKAAHIDDKACLTVEDNGKGLPPELAAQVLPRYGQLDTKVGSGLGLSIVKAVVERHSGMLKINRSQNGASLTISFPQH